MALYVNTKACDPNATICTDGERQYHLGVMMMVLGVGELTAKTLPEFLARLEFYQRLSDFMRPDEAESYAQAARESLGVKTNVTYEKEASWLKRMATDRFRDIARDQARRAEQPKAEAASYLDL